MYTRIRQYRVRDPEEATRRVRETFLPEIKKIPGFVGYYLVRGEGGTWASVSVFETREGVEQSQRLSDKWNDEHVRDLIESAEEAVIGETVIAEMTEREHEHHREHRREHKHEHEKRHAA